MTGSTVTDSEVTLLAQVVRGRGRVIGVELSISLRPACRGGRTAPVAPDLLRRLGRHEEAIEAYRAALALTGNAAERAFLAARLPGSAAGMSRRGGR
ncbi:MAG TPA: hypothetical protein VFI47_06560 [Acidimicrobiales bacterium]|nr:hypothetical protein [Acidimicrobiales bacterium]